MRRSRGVEGEGVLLPDAQSYTIIEMEIARWIFPLCVRLSPFSPPPFPVPLSYPFLPFPFPVPLSPSLSPPTLVNMLSSSVACLLSFFLLRLLLFFLSFDFSLYMHILVSFSCLALFVLCGYNYLFILFLHLSASLFRFL